MADEQNQAQPVVGDLDDQGNVTEKGIIRSLVVMLALNIGVADEEERQLTHEDVGSIKHMLRMVLGELDRGEPLAKPVTSPLSNVPVIPGTDIPLPHTFGGV